MYKHIKSFLMLVGWRMVLISGQDWEFSMELFEGAQLPHIFCDRAIVDNGLVNIDFTQTFSLTIT